MRAGAAVRASGARVRRSMSGRSASFRATALGLVLAAGAGTVLAPAPASGQVPGAFGIEVRGGGAIGSYQPTGAGLQAVPGPAWSVLLSWGLTEELGLHMGYSAMTFGCDDAWCRGYDMSFVSRGPSVGARLQLARPLTPWLRAGLLLHDLDQRWTAAQGRVSETAAGRLGLEVAAGLTWNLLPGLDLVPGVHLGLTRTRNSEGDTHSALFTALDLGIRYRP